MKNYILLVIFSISLYGCGQSQDLSELDKMARKNAQTVLQDSKVSKQIEGKPYLLFSIKDHWYMIVVKNDEYIKEIYANLESSNKVVLTGSDKISKPVKDLNNAFDKGEYHKGFITLNSDYYKDGYEISSGNPTYFFYSDKDGNKHGESKLTALVKPNPINVDLYNYLLSKTLKNVGN